MKSLNEDLKTGQFKQIYLLYGEEAYLKKLYKNRFVKAMVPEGDTMNYRYFEGKNTNPKEIIDLAETLPFFAERRLIVLENTGFLKNATPELAEYLKNMPETTYMIFVESELDKRGKLYKAIKEKGHIVELKRQDEKTLIRWILGMAKKEKLQMSEAAVRYLLAKTGNDMENLGQELEKLFCYCMNHTEITAADIDEICTTQIGNHIFDMVDAIASHNQIKALDLYYDLLALKEPAMRIMYLISRQFNIMLTVKAMMNQGFGNKDIAKKAGCPEWAVRKYQSQCRAYSMEQIKQAVRDGVEYEEAVKTGRMNDQMAVELFIVQYSAAGTAEK